MAAKSEMLTLEEFASLITVGDTPINGPGAKIPAEHSARLLELGYMVHLSGRLRMTTPGRQRISAESQQVGSPRHKSRSADSGAGGMTLVDAKKTFVEKTAEGRRCSNCGAVASFVGQMLDPTKGRTIRMFRCHCGEQAWFSDPA
jgi:hypothetical protein